MQKYKSLVLPVALVAGFFLRSFCATLAEAVPYVIFAILVLTFSGVRLSKLRPSKLDLWLAIFQTVVSFSLYAGMKILTGNEILAQGTMMCVLCPVASSVTVVAAMLGANPVRTTSYTIVGNLLVTIIAPVYMTLISESATLAAGARMFLIFFTKIAIVIALPFVIMLLLQKFLPNVNKRISDYKQLSFYLWAFALFVTIGHTLDFVVARWHENYQTVLWLGGSSLIICMLQFYIGRKIGHRFGDNIAGGQLLGQKNSAMGIWMLNSFLNPVSSAALAFYSIWQNLFNSWQIARSPKKAY